MFHTTLSKGKHTAQRKKERYIGVQVKRTGKHTIESQEKRDRRYCKPGSKDRVLTIYMYTNQPRPIDKAYNPETSRIKLEIT